MLNLDTNILVAVLDGSLRKDEVEVLESDGQRAISAIVLWEVAMLHKAKRIQFGPDDSLFLSFLEQVEILPLTLEIARTAQHLDFKSDPADEIIAATSIVHRAPLLTRDSRMLGSSLVPLAVK